MKKSLVLMAMAGVALAGCVNDVAEVAQNQEQKKVKITFDTPVLYNNAESRATFYGEIGSHTYDGSSTIYTYPKEESFVIYAVQHEGDLTSWKDATKHEMDSKSISYDKSVDGWAPKKNEDEFYIWPSEPAKMSFAASSPADLECAGATRTYGEDGLTIENFEIQKVSAKQYDLLYSQRAINKTSADMRHGADYYSGVPINFYHSLSSIRFSLQNATDAVVVLNEIRVGGVKYKGTFKEDLDEDATSYKSDPKWNVVDEYNTTEDLKQDLAAGYLGFKGAVTFPIEPQYVAVLAASDTDAADETEECHQLLLMPQALTDNAKIYVGYTVNGNFHSKVVEINGMKDLDEMPVGEWERGRRYTYRLVYSKSTAIKDIIYFAPDSEKWDDHKAIVVEL